MNQHDLKFTIKRKPYPLLHELQPMTLFCWRDAPYPYSANHALLRTSEGFVNLWSKDGIYRPGRHTLIGEGNEDNECVVLGILNVEMIK